MDTLTWLAEESPADDGPLARRTGSAPLTEPRRVHELRRHERRCSLGRFASEGRGVAKGRGGPSSGVGGCLQESEASRLGCGWQSSKPEEYLAAECRAWPRSNPCCWRKQVQCRNNECPAQWRAQSLPQLPSDSHACAVPLHPPGQAASSGRRSGQRFAWRSCNRCGLLGVGLPRRPLSNVVDQLHG